MRLFLALSILVSFPAFAQEPPTIDQMQCFGLNSQGAPVGFSISPDASFVDIEIRIGKIVTKGTLEVSYPEAPRTIRMDTPAQDQVIQAESLEQNRYRFSYNLIRLDPMTIKATRLQDTVADATCILSNSWDPFNRPAQAAPAKPVGLEGKLEAALKCQKCSIEPAQYSAFLKTVETDASKNTSSASQELETLAKLTFDRRTEDFPERTKAISYLLSKPVLKSPNGLDDLITTLLVDIPSDQLATDIDVQLQNMIRDRSFDANAARAMLDGIMKNHAKLRNLQPTLTADTELKLLQALQANAATPADMKQVAGFQYAWIQAEQEMQTATNISEVLDLVKDKPSPALLEDAVQYVIGESTVTDAGKEIIARAIAGLSAVPIWELDFSYEGFSRGLTNDLVRYAFSDQAKRQGDAAAVVTAVVNDSRTAPNALNQIILHLEEFDTIDAATGATLLAKIVQHPHFYDQADVDHSGENSPTEAILAVATSSFNQAHWPQRPKFAQFLMEDLLGQMLASGKLPPELQKMIQEFIIHEGSI